MPTQFYLVSIFYKFDYVQSEEVSLIGNVYDLSVDYNAIDKFDILKIHRYLITKNNINNVWAY